MTGVSTLKEPSVSIRRTPTRLKSVALLGTAVAALLALAACGSSSTSSGTTSAAATTAAAGSAAAGASGAASGSAAAGGGTAADTLRLGYFPNVTHAAAVLGVKNGTFQEALGDTKLETTTFNAGPAATEALLSGAIDATFIGPNPAINSFAKSNGEAIRIVAGATDNGASFVVAKDINGPADLKGKTLATPQLGGTQDVALRKWLLDNDLKVQTTGGSDVDIVNQENSQTLDLFKSGEIAGAWLPEPWASRLVNEADGKVLVDEKTLWPDEKFQTTILIVATPFLEQHPDTVKALIGGEITEIKAIEADPAKAQTDLNAALGELTGKPLSDETIKSAFANIEPTWDPLAGTLNTIAENGLAAGTLTEKPDLNGIYDLRQLNAVLAEQGQPPVSSAGLGQE